MSLAPARTPPPDNSGGLMHVRFQRNGRTVHIERFHVAPFDANSFAYSDGPGTEADIPTTFGALAGVLEGLYNNEWAIQLTALDQKQAGGMVRVGTPTATGGGFLSHGGTGATATGTGQEFIQSIMNFKTAGGHRARVRVVGAGGQGIAGDTIIGANAAGTPWEQLVNYLTGTASQIVGHDNTKLKLPAHTTYALRSRSRRLSQRLA
jgi:hypothetical protein